MALRRGERPDDSDDDTHAQYICYLSSDGSEAEHPPRDPPRTRRPRVRHPRPSTFGPLTLSQYVRQEIAQAKAENSEGKGNGKARKSSPPRARNNRSEQADTFFDDTETVIRNSHKTAGLLRRTSVTLSPNALDNLRSGHPHDEQKSIAKAAAADRSRVTAIRKSSRRSLPLLPAADGLDDVTNPNIPINSLSTSGCNEAVKPGDRNTTRAGEFSRHASSKRRSTRRRSNSHIAYQPNSDNNNCVVEDDDSLRPRKTPQNLTHAVQGKSNENSNPSRLGPSLKQRLNDTNKSESVNSVEDHGSVINVNPTASIGFFDSDSQHFDNDSTFFDQDRTLNAQPRATPDISMSATMNGGLANPDMATPAQAQYPSTFDYSQVVPEVLPRVCLEKNGRQGNGKKTGGLFKSYSIPTGSQRRETRRSYDSTDDDKFDDDDDDDDPLPSEKSKGRSAISRASNIAGQSFPRVRKPDDLSALLNAPSICLTDGTAEPRNLHPENRGLRTDESCLPGFNHDSWLNLASFLAAEDVRNLRLVSKGFANVLAPIMLRSVVVNFGKALFDVNVESWDAKSELPSKDSMLSRYGKTINKFGIAFEYDFMGLANATPKIIEREENAWYGSFTWPLEKYPRFAELQALEDLVDNNRPLLKNAIANLEGATELALSIDSGHGWMEGPDMSDLALYELLRSKGSEVFGKTFKIEDVWHKFARNEYFKWAQQNAIHETLKELSTRQNKGRNRKWVREFENLLVRDHESFIIAQEQPDLEPHSHTGAHGHIATAVGGNGVNGAPAITGPPALLPNPPVNHAPNQGAAQAQNLQLVPWRPFRLSLHGVRKLWKPMPKSNPPPPQWPLIFNCHNISAAVGGVLHWAADKTADPARFPVLPGSLTETQVQWLMETVWAQRVFLSAYTTAIITNRMQLKTIHTLNISKLSSGLLPSLAQSEFWSSLAGLKKLKLLIKPDWNQEHIVGDSFYSNNMSVSPLVATTKFAEFLQRFIARLEGLSHLTVGYVGGGEHAIGMFARNQHVLPAPITDNPRPWISDHSIQPNPETLFKFDHIREMTFTNCWFSPCMLETFMLKSRDTSLHTLTLDSVSMLSKHDSGIDGPLTSIHDDLKTQYAKKDYLLEAIPSSASWVDVLDKVTPGETLLDKKYASGLIDTSLKPQPSKEFRGNIQQIVLKSCGYAKISGVKGDEFNQNALVVHQSPSMDAGLATRKRRFEKGLATSRGSHDSTSRPSVTGSTPRPDGTAENTSISSTARSIMRSTIDPKTATDYFGLGTLTQCVHPIEKRVLECGWGVQFGWGNDIRRWAAVEDGFFEGGTGRFSGVIGVGPEVADEWASKARERIARQ